MNTPQTVTLDPALASEAPLIANLLELYIHDLSDIFPNIELGADGRFGYGRLPLYWSEPERRFPFVIRCDGRIAGFVLAQRGSPVNPSPEALDVEEFFVLRRYRRAAVGRRAATLLWKTLPGSWTVRVAENNRGALSFWRGVIGEFTSGSATEAPLVRDDRLWCVFSFTSVGASVNV